MIFEMTGDSLDSDSDYGKGVMNLRKAQVELIESGRLIR